MMWRRDLERAVREFSEDLAALIESALSPIRHAPYIGPDGYRRPLAHAYVDGDSVVAVFELPGASKDGIRLTVREGEVEVEAKLSDEVIAQAPRHPWFKNVKGYRRTLTLPRRVEADEAKATYRDGVLVVKAPISSARGVSVKVE